MLQIILEYFHVDKFIVEKPPWIFVCKDFVPALIYILPLIEMAMSDINDFKAIKGSLSKEALIIFRQL